MTRREKNIKLQVFAGGFGATLFARIIPLSSALEKKGVDCVVKTPFEWKKYVKGKFSHILSVGLTHSPHSYLDAITNLPDVVVIGRISSPQVLLFVKLLRKKGVKVIFDLDDALFLPTASIMGLNLRAGTFCLDNVIKNSDYVTTNGHYLLKYVQKINANSTFIQDPVDTTILIPKIKSNNKKITIGWHGNPKAHYTNLPILLNPLEKLSKEYNIKFKLVSYLGDQRIKNMFDKLRQYAEVDFGLNYWVPTSKYWELISEFDILVAPLKKDLWYEGKSALRVGLGMALGIPVVASPVGEQKYLIKHGLNGYLAENDLDWFNCLKVLIENNETRNNIGREARKTALNELSLDVCGQRYFEIINEVLKRD